MDEVQSYSIRVISSVASVLVKEKWKSTSNAVKLGILVNLVSLLVGLQNLVVLFA